MKIAKRRPDLNAAVFKCEIADGPFMIAPALLYYRDRLPDITDSFVITHQDHRVCQIRGVYRALHVRSDQPFFER